MKIEEILERQRTEIWFLQPFGCSNLEELRRLIHNTLSEAERLSLLKKLDKLNKIVLKRRARKV